MGFGGRADDRLRGGNIGSIITSAGGSSIRSRHVIASPHRTSIRPAAS